MTIANDVFQTMRAADYQSIRAQINNGDLLLCSGNGAFSDLIKKGTDSIWSHVAFILRLDSIDRVMVLESVESQGVRTVPLSNYVYDYKDGKGYDGQLLIARHDGFPAGADVATSDQLKAMAKFAVDRFGYSYDVDEIVKIATRIATGGAFNNGVLQRDREYICSEYAEECYKRFGVTIPPDRRGFIAPADFAKEGQVRPIAALKISDISQKPV